MSRADQFRLLTEQGEAFEKREDYTNAEKKYRAALALTPSDWSAKRRVEKVLFQQALDLEYRRHDYRGAIEKLRKARALSDLDNAYDWCFARLEGRLAEKNGDKEGALRAYRDAARLSPSHERDPGGLLSKLLYETAIQANSRRDFALANTRLHEALRLSPNDAAIYSALTFSEGGVFEDSAAYPAAIAKYAEVLKNSPNDSSARSGLAAANLQEARMLLETQSYLAAIDKYKAALSVSGDNDEAKRGLASAEAALAKQRQARPGLASQVPPLPEAFKHYKNGVVGGTGWELGTYVRNLPPDATIEMHAYADKKLREQIDVARASGKDVEVSKYTALKDYNFVIGLAISTDWYKHDIFRTLADELTAGLATPIIQDQYNLLRGRSFDDELVCHSNGAMICLAALRNGDVKAKKVQLLGPQLTPDTLVEWNALREKGIVENVEVLINEHDNVPLMTMTLGSVLPLGIAATLEANPLGRIEGALSPILDTYTANGGSYLRTQRAGAAATFGTIAPLITIKYLPCDASSLSPISTECHDFVKYEQYRHPEKWERK